MTHLLAATSTPSEQSRASLGKPEGKQVRLREVEAEGRGAVGGASGVLALVCGGRSGAGLEVGISLGGWEVIGD